MLVLASVIVLAGCEGSNNDSNNGNTTTITNNHPGGGGSSSSSSSSSSSGGGGGASSSASSGGGGGSSSSSSSSPVTPAPAVSSSEVTVVNSSSYAVNVNGTVISSGSSHVWSFTGSFTITFDTLAGYTASVTVTGSGEHFANIHNSTGVPGTVEISSR